MCTTPQNRQSLASAAASLLLVLTASVNLPSVVQTASAQSAASQGSSSSGRFGYLRDLMNLSSGSAVSSARSQSSAASSVFTLPPLPAIPSLPPLAPVTGSSSSAAMSASSAGVIAATQTMPADPALHWISASDKLAISVTPNRFEVFPGETITYTIRVCNRTNEELRDIPVVFAYMGHEMKLVSVSDNGTFLPGNPAQRLAELRYDLAPVRGTTIARRDGVTFDNLWVRSHQDRVGWTLPVLAAGATRTYTVTLRMDSRLFRGYITRGDALAKLSAADPIRALSQVAVLERMPASGANESGIPSEAPYIDEVWHQTVNPFVAAQ